MSTSILENLCQIFPENKYFDIKIVGGAMHSVLFENYKSDDVDLHFIPKKKLWSPYKELIDCFKNMQDPFDQDNIRKTLAFNYNEYNSVLNRILTDKSAYKFTRNINVELGNPMILCDVDLSHKYFMIMNEISNKMTITRSFKNYSHVPFIFTKDAYNLLKLGNFDNFIKFTMKRTYDKTEIVPIEGKFSGTIEEMFNALVNTTDPYFKWLGYCKWCNALFHNVKIQAKLKVDTNRKHILSVTIDKKYQSIELDIEHMRWYFLASDVRESLILALMTFHVNPKPHFGAIIDSSLYTPVHLSDEYKNERLRMYYDKNRVFQQINKIGFDTSQAYARELIMRSLPYCDIKNLNDEKFRRISARIKDLDPKLQACDDIKKKHQDIKALAKVEKAISKKRLVCSLKRTYNSI